MITNSNRAYLVKMLDREFQEAVNEIVPHQFFEKRRCHHLTTSPQMFASRQAESYSLLVELWNRHRNQ
jgi:hypothetical protein